MKLITFLLAILLPVLLIAACHTEVGEDCDQLGGPYPKGGNFADGVLEGKQRDFAGYKALGLSVSQAVELKDDTGLKLLQKSIQANFETSGQQRYNYAITVDCKIFMAAWSASDLTLGVSDIACAGGRNLTPAGSVRPEDNQLIDFAPEQPFGAKVMDDKLSPCWLDAERKKGILDAISKHFMLAQGEKGKIADYDEEKWSKTKVAYAGEILVNTDECTYVLTPGSGTYQPLSDHLLAANEFFAKQLNNPSRRLDKAFCKKP